MKKIFVVFLVISFLFFSFPAGASASEDVSIFIQNHKYNFSPSPVIWEGQVLIPMRSFFEEMGANVQWYNDSRIALAYSENIEVSVMHNGESPIINGEEISSLSNPARVIEGNIYVPLRLAAGSMGLHVGWDEDRFAVIMTESDENGTGYFVVDEKTAEREADTMQSFVSTGHFIWPVDGGQITSPYGWRRGRFHAGMDIGASTGTSIFASDGGVVVFEGWDGAYGRSIVIKHGTYYTRYAHNSVNLVKTGDIVTQGQVIGQVGTTGRTTGSHLHFEIRTGGIYGPTINPARYVSR